MEKTVNFQNMGIYTKIYEDERSQLSFLPTEWGGEIEGQRSPSKCEVRDCPCLRPQRCNDYIND